ncbi:MAG TPA: hypothetical protein DFR83_09900 [Deltaproteobacteria bacterium]|nr:hypothetical protein [Deltaproteobacteria bacterium]
MSSESRGRRAGLRMLIASLVGLLAAAPTPAGEHWLTAEGAGGIAWGESTRPAKFQRRSRRFTLADDGFVGLGPSDAPHDIEVEYRNSVGERRFMRYVDERLVDAWLLRVGPIDDSYYSTHGKEQFRGAIVGPAEDGWVGVGDAISWQLGDRTVLHWRDRLTDTELLANRAIPGRRYSARRPEPLKPGGKSTAKIGISGELKKFVKPYSGMLSKCLDASNKPIRLEVVLRYDRLGRLSRVRVNTDTVVYEVERCVAGALIRTGAPPDLEGSFSVYRHQ